MQDPDIAAWGKTLLEEIVLQAALAVPDSATPLEGRTFSMPFRITADAAGRLLVSSPCIGGDDLVLQVGIPADDAA